MVRLKSYRNLQDSKECHKCPCGIETLFILSNKLFTEFLTCEKNPGKMEFFDLGSFTEDCLMFNMSPQQAQT